MRIPGWLFLVGLAVFVLGTALCSVISFTAARQVPISLVDSGVKEIPSLPQFVQLAVSRNLDSLRAQPSASIDIANVPTLTPQPTVQPTTAANTEATALPAAQTVSTPLPPTATLDPLADYAITDPRRINILLLGIDQRRGEEGPFRTDTIIVVSLDPVRKTAGMLSIPRDLYVSIPGFVQDRINNANVIGEANAYPGGGPALAARTIKENLGIDVERYLMVNFDLFTTMVDLVAPNGVEVCPTERIDDEYYPDGSYGFMRVTFEAGCQSLNAERLLQYARTRHGNSDFDRAARQQEVIKAVRDEVLTAGGVANFIGQAPRLWQELSDSYSTNMSLEELIGVALLVQDIPRESITSGVIGAQQTSFARTADGQDVLIPNYGAIRSLFQQVFNPQTSEMTLSDLRTRAEAENASIVVYNNTAVAGLAGQTRDWLASRQLSVSAVGNMPTPDGSVTIIRDYTGKTWTARYLAALMNLPGERIQPGTDGLTSEDIMIVVGSDVQPLLTGGG
jgi:polyisoprenyl-teichoic acid--peptidoglycan teichoic acid transferase